MPNTATTDNQEAVKALPERLVAAMNARDLDAIMSVYVPDESLFVFDTMPPRQFVGATAYRKAFEGLLAAYPRPTTFEVRDLSATTDSQLGFAHYVVHMIGTAQDGSVTEMNFRLTSCARKIGGTWLIVHEHVSFPVDLVTGRADFLAQP